MKSSKFWIAVLVCGVVANIIDWAVYSLWLGPTYMMSNAVLFRQDTNPGWFVFGDFVSVFIFAWVLDKVSSVFGTTAQAGAKAGMYLGILVSFPTYIFMNLMFNGYPYSLSWISTIYGVCWYVVIGAIFMAMLKKGKASA